MPSKTFTLSLMASMAAARHHGNTHTHALRASPNTAVEGFEYVGCVKADPASFGLVVDFFGPFSAQDCQNSCATSGAHAALGGGCHCDVPFEGEAPLDYEIVDDDQCFHECIEGDEDAGKCGGDEGVFSLYKEVDLEKREDCDEHAEMNAAAEPVPAPAPAPAPPAEAPPAPAPPAPAPPAAAPPAPPAPAVKVAVAPAAAPAPPAKEEEPKPALEVVHECPEDCAEHGGEKLSLLPIPEDNCPPGGCAPPPPPPAEAPVPAPAPPAPNAKLVVDCPPEGCHAASPIVTPAPVATHNVEEEPSFPPPANKAADVLPPVCDGTDCVITPPAPIGTPLPVCPGPQCQQSTTLTRAATPTGTAEIEDTGSESGPVSGPVSGGDEEEPPAFNGAERGVVVSWTPIVVTVLLAAVIAL